MSSITDLPWDELDVQEEFSTHGFTYVELSKHAWELSKKEGKTFDVRMHWNQEMSGPANVTHFVVKRLM